MNKSCKYRYLGGVLLGNTIAIVASISNSVVNADETEDFKHFAHEISWKAYASLKVNDTSKNEWYQAKQYSDSIYNVIANAIADCKMQKNEFKDPVPGNGIVEFDAKPDNANYTEENWNALVLWNFLAEAIHGRLKTEVLDKFSKECIEKVGKKITDHYKNIDGIAGFITEAVNDIQEYAQALGLYEYLRKSKTGFYSNIQPIKTDDCITKVTIKNAIIKDNDKTTQTEITVVYKDNNTLAYKVFDNRYVTLNQDMSINTDISGTDPIYLYIDDGSNQQNKEYFNSRRHMYAIMCALKGSPKMKKCIEKIATTKLTNKKVKTWNVCKNIYKIFHNTTYAAPVMLKNIERSIMKYLEYENELRKDPENELNNHYYIHSSERDRDWQHQKTISGQTHVLLNTILNAIRHENNKITPKEHCPFEYDKYIRRSTRTDTGTNTELDTIKLVSFPTSNESENIAQQINKQGLKTYKAPDKKYESTQCISPYPDVIITTMAYDFESENTTKCPKEIVIQEIHEQQTDNGWMTYYIKKSYKLKSNVWLKANKNIISSDDYYKGFPEYNKSVKQLVAIYEKQED